MLNHECEDNVKIASLSMAYDNREIIEILKSRGQNLVNGKQKQLRKDEEKINKLVKQQKDKFKRPVFAFVTFNCQEGYERCMKWV